MTKTMNRYALFMYPQYYPSGGWGDYAGSFDTPENAMTVWEERKQEYEYDFYHIIDLNTGKVVPNDKDE